MGSGNWGVVNFAAETCTGYVGQTAYGFRTVSLLISEFTYSCQI